MLSSLPLVTPANSIADRMEDAVRHIQVMRTQEQTSYKKTRSIMSTTEHRPQHIAMVLQEQQQQVYVDQECRAKMGIWFYQIIDFCKFNRETAEIAMSYLDRYYLYAGLSSKLVSFDREHFQLVCMTCLYTAVKVHEHDAMDLKLVSLLSRGLYTVQQIETMERTILSMIQWKMNPPTSFMFVRDFMNLMPDVAVDDATRTKIDELVKLQVEYAVPNYMFLETNASTIAFCSFMNAVEILIKDDDIVEYIGCILAKTLQLDCNCSEVLAVQTVLYNAVIVPSAPMHNIQAISSFTNNIKGGTSANAITFPPKREVYRTISPRCITSIP